MGARPVWNGSAATQGNELNWIQTAGNVARVLGFGSSRSCGFCNPCLLKQMFNLPLFATGWEKKVDATQTRVLQQFWLYLPGHSQGTWPTLTGGAIVAWDFSEPSLTFSWSFPHSLLSQRALNSFSENLSINTKELFDSEEHISSAQRTSAILSKLKQSCATTLGFQNRCPAGKEKVKLSFCIKCTFIFLVH